MTVRIRLTSTEEAGTTHTAKGEELLWNVHFRIENDGERKFQIHLDFQIVGPAGAAQAKQAAYAELAKFLNEASIEAAKQGGA